jgi:hypothetical protein
MARVPAPSTQLVLDIGVEVERNVNGVEMGVLENGIPFLTQTGLAQIAGVARSVIFDISQDWEAQQNTGVVPAGRMAFIAERLAENGYNDAKLFIQTTKDGAPHNAYPDVVCMAIIEYYAFEARVKTVKAIDAYRRLATYGLQSFIYKALGYTPPDKFKYYHDRVSILHGSVPDGYFSVFNEVGGMIIDLIEADLAVNDKTIPDISVGRCWGDHWQANGLAEKYGERINYAHSYPAYYPQAKSNPQSAWAYPDEALPEFRRWFKHEYLTTKFPRYILTKANLLGGQEAAKRIGNLYQPKAIPDKRKRK